MRKIWRHIRWWLAYHIDPGHVSPEHFKTAQMTLWSDDGDTTDPRDTYQEGG